MERNSGRHPGGRQTTGRLGGSRGIPNGDVMTRLETRTPKRRRRLLEGAGLLLAGATLAAVAGALSPSVAGAGETKAGSVNYVRDATPDPVAGVLLDEEVVVFFNAAVLPSSVGPDTVLVRTGINNSVQAHGRYVVGAFLYDKSVQRRVIIRPEAVREYYELVE